MGDTFGTGSENEKPVEQVCVTDFYIGKYEVTQRQWTDLMGNNPSNFKNCDTCPVENISWHDVQVFIERLARKTGENYRLPTEAEWEYAARGGKRERWAGISNEYELSAYAYYEKNSGGKIHPVGELKPNGFGLYDMSGNVREWVADWYDESYSGRISRDNPKGPFSGAFRVIRSGSWLDKASNTSVTSRTGYSPGGKDRSLGFRLVRTR